MKQLQLTSLPTETMSKTIKYFPGLSALRFFAAYLVLMHHTETIRQKYGLFNLEAYTLFRNGSTAVSFFFVLSGFLISYLLLKEDKESGDISVKGFYWRRVVRIWPLYFLLVIIGVWLVPFALKTIGFEYQMPYSGGEVWWMYLLFLPFLVNTLFGSSLLEPLWSIGVEEWFYIIWAPLMKFFRQHMLLLFWLIIVIKTSLITLLMLMDPQPGSFLDVTRQVVDTLKFEAMAIGGIGAYYVFHGTKSFDNWKIFSPVVQLTGFTLLIWRLVFHGELVASNIALGEVSKVLFNTPVISNLILYVLFLWLILSISLNPKSWINLDKKWLNSLGDVSYGIYMYQMLVIFGVILIFKNHLQQLSPLMSTLVFYGIISVGVIGVSYLSKFLFENKFLKWKSLVK
ncbi:acyltransferase family protein [Solitalea canadensis]|uniref:Putative acyltransferase n=1 Tax=Solitalea canadensis (strain ATCC 29591 / DSM 3403 / JCM 21819 / LMG 8368 / NBRC 15130 / NCIMB 12057 / USAM 9D) TaxID=929556 RepID=H8KUI0_SOLCM|nr:acyltransferase [Solitalea canadensis]AFD07345.1 putative acyltransferase [Solitalea canadensis DSM 3403]